MKFKINKPISSDAGVYSAMKDVKWGSEVVATYVDDNKVGIKVKGKGFISIGGCDKAFNPDWDYVWGCFEEIR